MKLYGSKFIISHINTSVGLRGFNAFTSFSFTLFGANNTIVGLFA